MYTHKYIFVHIQCNRLPNLNRLPDLSTTDAMVELSFRLWNPTPSIVYITVNFRPHSPFSEKSIKAISGPGGGITAGESNLDRKDFSFI